MTERERFESWARQRWTHPEDFDQRIKAPSKYNNYEVQAAWDAWQERAAPSVPEESAVQTAARIMNVDLIRQRDELRAELSKQQALTDAAQHIAGVAQSRANRLQTKIAELEQQDPVAWRTFDGEGGYDYRSYEDNENYKLGWDARNPNHIGWVEPLYTLHEAKGEEKCSE